ncbi:hypothetical protein WN943_029557 [Citrus x changshan-huyou]
MTKLNNVTAKRIQQVPKNAIELSQGPLTKLKILIFFESDATISGTKLVCIAILIMELIIASTSAYSTSPYKAVFRIPLSSF